MPKKGQTQPFKMIFQYPGEKVWTNPHATFDSADRDAADVGRRGAAARVVFRSKDPAKGDFPLSAYGPDSRHDITWRESPSDGNWKCSCGALRYARYGLVDHLERVGMEMVTWLLVRGTSPGARAYEPAPLGIDVPGYVLDWAEHHGLSVDEPDLYLLVTFPREAREVIGEVASMSGALPPEETEVIASHLNEADTADLPEWAREEPR